MLSLHKTHQNAHFNYQKKEISIDRYDSDSDEEDQRREQLEIKRVITNARIKHSSKSNNRNLHTSANASNSAIKAKLEALHSPSQNISAKLGDSQGFFPATTSFMETTTKRTFAEEMRKLSQPKPKIEEKSPHKPRDTRTLLDMDKASTVLAKSEKQIENRINGSKKRLPELLTSSKDLEFQKESFNSLLSFYSKSTSKQPVKLVLHRPHMSNRVAQQPKSVENPRKEPVDASLQISHIGNNEVSEGNIEKEVNGVEVKDFQELIPELIKAVTVAGSEPLEKRIPFDVPRLKSLDWAGMMKKAGSTKLELLIVDPINFVVEDCLEINSEDPQQVRDIVNEAVKEVIPEMNEAKLILMYYYDRADQKRLLFSKFFFFLKNHRHYMKGIRNEKDVVAHYLFILALLQFRVAYETKPFKDDKVEASKRKAFNLFKNNEPFTSFVSEWLAFKVQPIISIEKVYISLTVGGKADSNFTFNIHEHLCYAYPKFTQIIHHTLKTNSSQKSLNAIESKTMGSVGISPRETNDEKNTIPHIPINMESNKDLRTSQRGDRLYYTAASNPAKKSDSMMYMSDFTEQMRKNENFAIGSRSVYMAQFAVQPPKTAMPSPVRSPMSHGLIREVPGTLGSMGQRSMSVTGSAMISTTPRINKAENKVYLGNQRMNTSYGQLLRQRFGKKNAWE